MHPLLQPLLVDQSGVVSRRQALDRGLTRTEVARLVRRRELVPIHPGVYVQHTGEPTWQQHAWAGVLKCWPAALGGHSALRAAEGPGSTRVTPRLEVVVDRDRHVAAPHPIDVRRITGLEQRVQWHVGPPRLRYEEATLDVAARARSDFAALGELSRAVQGRRTTATRLLDTLAGRERIARRPWMESVLRDVAAGACSVLEHGYLTKVERAHGLAPARRQVRDRVGSGVVYRDVEYAGGLVIELDGRLFHDTTTGRDRDLDRDLEAATRGKDSRRIGYGQVFDRPCWTAGCIGILLAMRGWGGSPVRCGPTCTL